MCDDENDENDERAGRGDAPFRLAIVIVLPAPPRRPSSPDDDDDDDDDARGAMIRRNDIEFRWCDDDAMTIAPNDGRLDDVRLRRRRDGSRIVIAIAYIIMTWVGWYGR